MVNITTVVVERKQTDWSLMLSLSVHTVDGGMSVTDCHQHAHTHTHTHTFKTQVTCQLPKKTTFCFDIKAIQNCFENNLVLVC